MLAPRQWLLVLAFAATACARRPAFDPMAPRPPRDPYVISAAELSDPLIIPMDALRAIRTLRPAFLRLNAPFSFVNSNAGQVHYSMDYGPVRPIGELVTITTALLVEIRYLDIHEAQNRFGLNASGGPVIVLLNNKVP